MVLEGTRDEVWMAFNSVLEPVYTAGSLGAVLFQVLSSIAHRQTICILESCLGLSIALSVVDFRMILCQTNHIISHVIICNFEGFWTWCIFSEVYIDSKWEDAVSFVLQTQSRKSSTCLVVSSPLGPALWHGMLNSLHLFLLLSIVKDSDFKMSSERIAVGGTSMIFSRLADVGNVLSVCCSDVLYLEKVQVHSF